MSQLGRRSFLNQEVINAICESVKRDILPIDEICKRHKIENMTFRQWTWKGRKCKETPAQYLTPSEMMCVQLVSRLDHIRSEHERKLIENITHPEHAMTARLVKCLAPDWNVLESAAQ